MSSSSRSSKSKSMMSKVTVEEEDAESGYVRAAVVPASGGDAADLEVQVHYEGIHRIASLLQHLAGSIRCEWMGCHHHR